MTTTPTPEAIEVTTAAYWDNGGKTWGSPSYAEARHNPEYLGRIGEAQRIITAALSAAYPLMEARAKAEAWDAVIARIDLGTPHMVDERYVAGANWVRNQIEDVLRATIEGKDS